MTQAMASLRLSLLGGFEARVGVGPPITFPRRKAQALLAYLALQPDQAHPRDKLAALLWGEATDEHARHSLRQALVAVRRALGATAPRVIVEEGDAVAIDSSAIDIDVAAFERAVRAGTPGAIAEAAALYRGDLLAGLGVQHVSFEDWLITERERLRELAIDVLARLLAHQSESGGIEAAIQTAVRLLGLDPTQEAVHRALMRLYARQGRRGAALRQYQVCVGILERELGTGPEGETRELYQHLLQEQPTGASTITARFAAGARLVLPIEGGDSDSPLIGRDAEIARLREAREAAWRGNGATVLILGEPGIGKSRLVEALVADAVQAGGHVLVGRAWDTERILPFGPWVGALRSGQVVPDLVEDLGPTWLSELARLFPELDAPDRETRLEDHLRLFEALARVVEHLAGHGPLVVVLEDLHWADEMSLRLLAFVARRVSARPVLVVGTVRSDELADAPMLRRVLAELDRHPHSVTLTPSPLSERETVELLRALSQTGTDERTIRARAEPVWRASQGNPFMAVETILALREHDVAPGGREIPMPARVRDVIAGRLERLTELARQLAGVAAVIGREFDFGLLVRAAAVSAADVARGLEELVGRRILHAVGERFDFTHDLIRQVAYAQPLVARRRLLHAATARAIEELYAKNLTPHVLALGRHYYEGEEWAHAFTYLAQAGHVASDRSAQREAVASFEQALAAFEHLPASRELTQEAIDIRFHLRYSLLALGDLPRVLDCLRAAAELAQSIGDEIRIGWAAALLNHCLALLGRHEEAVEAGRRARRAAEATGVFALGAPATFYLGHTHFYRGDFDQAEELLRLNVTTLVGDLAHDGFGILSAPLAITARAFLSLTLAERGEFDEALAQARETLARSEDPETPWGLFHACVALGRVHELRGEFEQAIGPLRRGLAVCETREVPLGVALTAAALGNVLAHAGHFDEALAILEPVTRTPWLPYVLIYAGEAYFLAGRLDEAAPLTARGVELCAGRQERGFEAWGLRLRGQIAASRTPPDHDAAEAQFREALALAAPRGMRPLVAHCHFGLAELYASLGKDRQAREHLTTATTMYREMRMLFWLEWAEAEGRK